MITSVPGIIWRFPKIKGTFGGPHYGKLSYMKETLNPKNLQERALGQHWHWSQPTCPGPRLILATPSGFRV